MKRLIIHSTFLIMLLALLILPTQGGMFQEVNKAFSIKIPQKTPAKSTPPVNNLVNNPEDAKKYAALKKAWQNNQKWIDQPGIPSAEKSLRSIAVNAANNVLDLFTKISPQNAVGSLLSNWLPEDNVVGRAAMIDAMRAILKYVSGATMPVPGELSIINLQDATTIIQNSFFADLQNSGFEPDQDKEKLKAQLANVKDSNVRRAWVTAGRAFIDWMRGPGNWWNRWPEYHRWAYIDAFCDMLKSAFSVDAKTPTAKRTFTFMNFSSSPATITPSICGNPSSSANNRFNEKPEENWLSVESGNSTGFYSPCPLDGFIVQVGGKVLQHYTPSIIDGNWGISDKEGIIQGS